MDTQTARESLKIGTRVVWVRDLDDGIVEAVEENRIGIAWESGERGWLFYEDCKWLELGRQL